MATERIFGQDYPAITRPFAGELAGLLIDDLEKLHRRLDSPYTAKWLASTRRYLE
jgi:hypothetical protein